MKAWPVHDAKARFSELLETCLREGPQLVTRRGARRRCSFRSRNGYVLPAPPSRHSRNCFWPIRKAQSWQFHYAAVDAVDRRVPRSDVSARHQCRLRAEKTSTPRRGDGLAQIRRRPATFISLPSRWRSFRRAIELTREQDAEKAVEIEAWADEVASAWNILPMDAAAFRLWAKLMHRRSDTLIEDAMIAATAWVHGLQVVTRNVRDFNDFGVKVLNPYTFR